MQMVVQSFMARQHKFGVPHAENAFNLSPCHFGNDFQNPCCIHLHLCLFEQSIGHSLGLHGGTAHMSMDTDLVRVGVQTWGQRFRVYTYQGFFFRWIE